MSLLLLFHGSPPPVDVAPWRWNGLLLPLHNPYTSVGVAPYLPHGHALTTTVIAGRTQVTTVTGGKTSTLTAGKATSTVAIDDGRRKAVIL